MVKGVAKLVFISLKECVIRQSSFLMLQILKIYATINGY